MAERAPKYPGYTALLPPAVRYDQELRPAAKLLYAEISAMSDVTGFCWASNRYLGALLGIAKRTVTDLLSQLEERGYIMIETLRNEKNEVTERRLFLTDAGLMRLPPVTKNTHPPIAKNGYTPIAENSDTPIAKNGDTPQYNKNDNILEQPPFSPPKGARPAKREHKSAPDWKADDFEKLWKWYPNGELPRIANRGNRQKAIRAWEKLHPDDVLIATIAEALARQAASEQWREGVGIPHLSTYLNNYSWEGWERDEE